MELTTVADDHAVVHDGLAVRHYDGLQPDTLYELDGFAFRTLRRPEGRLLSTFATVNDVHFGEVECGHLEGVDLGYVCGSARFASYAEDLLVACGLDPAAIRVERFGPTGD